MQKSMCLLARMLRIRHNACFDFFTKLGLLAAMISANFNPSRRTSSSPSTTLVTKPTRNASLASNSLPLKVTSKIQLLFPTSFGNNRRNRESAKSMCLIANDALEAEIRISQALINPMLCIQHAPSVTQITATSPISSIPARYRRDFENT